jgi:hypothetical protein
VPGVCDLLALRPCDRVVRHEWSQHPAEPGHAAGGMPERGTQFLRGGWAGRLTAGFRIATVRLATP